MKNLFVLSFAFLLATLASLTRHFDLSHHALSHRTFHFREPLESENLESRALWDYLRLRDPATGEIPRGIHIRELAFAQRIRSSFPAFKGTPSIHTTGWNSAGPINTGGRTLAIGVDVSNEANVLIATAQGGVFRSTDSGATWTRTSAPGELKDMTCLTQDHRPGKTGIWYAGTGELISTTWRRTAVYTEPDYHNANIGNGIYKSTDDGRTWNVLPSTVSPDATLLDSVFDGVWSIALDSSRIDSDIVYAAGFGAIMRSNNGGTTWKRVLGDPLHVSFATEVAVSPSGIVYAYLSGSSATGGVSSTAGIWRSMDGLHWTNISPSDWPANMGRLKLAIAPSDENVVYVGGIDPKVWFGAMFQKYTYFSGDGTGAGGHWEDRSANVPSATDSLSSYGINTYGGYAVTLAVHPTDADLVFFGGTNIYRSFDGFSSNQAEWIGGYDQVNGGYGQPGLDHPDHHDLTFVPSNPSVAYDATDGGMYLTYDILGTDDPNYPVTWQAINTNNQSNIVYVVALDHASPGDSTIAGGFQDQGSWIDLGQNEWQMYYGGDGCYCAIADHKSAYYLSSQEGYVTRWTLGSDFSYQGYAGIMPGGAGHSQFVTPWMLDPTNNDQMYFASNNTLWRNDDLAGIPDNQDYSTYQNWVELSRSTLPQNTDITALGMSHIPQHRLYYGTSNGRLFRMDNANATSPTSQEITGSSFPKNAFISCVAVDPQNADSIVVCFSNYHVISIFASSDGGTTWHNASGNLEENPDGSGDGPSVRWVTIVHQHGETLYLCGTSVGLFSTTDISGPNVTWLPEGTSTIGYAIVENIDARQSDGFVAIATQGSGVYTTNVVASPNAVKSTTPTVFNFTITPNPAKSIAVVSISNAPATVSKLSVLDLSGKTVFAAKPPFDGPNYSLDCSKLRDGSYFVEIQAGDAIETRRLIVMK